MKPENGMKLYELIINGRGIRFRHANPHPLTANQKCGIVFAIIGALSFLVFFWRIT